MIEITKEAIDSVPPIKLPFIKDSDNSVLQHICKQVLYTAHKENEDKEVAVILDAFDFNRACWFKGNEKHVNINIDWSVLIDKEDYYNRYIVIHNHPSYSGIFNAGYKEFFK